LWNADHKVKGHGQAILADGAFYMDPIFREILENSEGLLDQPVHVGKHSLRSFNWFVHWSLSTAELDNGASHLAGSRSVDLHCRRAGTVPSLAPGSLDDGVEHFFLVENNLDRRFHNTVLARGMNKASGVPFPSAIQK
jgi:hypothetical protein